MRYNIVKTENYLLIVDDSEIKEGDYSFYWDDVLKVQIGVNYSNPKAHKKIIAHLPLNNSPILEGVDLLPPFEDEVEKKLNENCNPKIAAIMIKGYNKAKEKYKYTEEDLRKALSESFKASQEGYQITSDEIIQSLQQPKLPVGFECEQIGYAVENDEPLVEIKTTTNSEGQTVWVGKYIY